MLFRGRQPETSLWKRFRTSADGFSFIKEEDYYAAHLVANSERVADLFEALLEHMPPAVDVSIRDARTGTQWEGTIVALPDVRDAIARLKSPLASFGGVEISVFTTDDQLTLNPVMELFVYARSDQWLYILQGKGLEQRRSVRTRSWKLGRVNHPPAPELSEAVAAAAASLGLASR